MHVLDHDVARSAHRLEAVLGVESVRVPWFAAKLDADLLPEQYRVDRVERRSFPAGVFVHRGSESTNRYINSVLRTRFTQAASFRTTTQNSAAVGRRYGTRYADLCSLNSAAHEHP